MVAQEHDAAMVAARPELHVVTQPLDERVLEPARRPQDVLDDRPADRVVARVERDHAPVVVLEAEEARLLPAPRRMHAHLREQKLEIGIAERVHLVVAVQREAAHSARRPRARRVVVVGIVDPQEVLVHLRQRAYVVDVAQVDREVRMALRHLPAHSSRLVGARPPVAGQRHPHPPAAIRALQRIDAAIGLARQIEVELVPPAESVLHIRPNPIGPGPRVVEPQLGKSLEVRAEASQEVQALSATSDRRPCAGTSRPGVRGRFLKL